VCEPVVRRPLPSVHPCRHTRAGGTGRGAGVDASGDCERCMCKRSAALGTVGCSSATRRVRQVKICDHGRRDNRTRNYPNWAARQLLHDDFQAALCLMKELGLHRVTSTIEFNPANSKIWRSTLFFHRDKRACEHANSGSGWSNSVAVKVARQR
jgi:hypothetical protein